jgi:hypothetical protein
MSVSKYKYILDGYILIYLQYKIYIISVELYRKILLLLVSCNRKDINFTYTQSHPFKYRIQNLPHRRFYQLYPNQIQ